MVGVLLVLVVGGGPGRARVQQHWHVMDLWHIVACWGGTAWRRWATSHALTRAGAGWAGSLLFLSAGTKGWRQGLALRAAVPAARTHALAAPHPTHPSSHPTRLSSHLRYAPLILSPTLRATHPPTHPPRCAALLQLLSDEAKAYRDWELEKAMSEALAMSSYQLENTANRCGPCVWVWVCVGG